MVRDINFTVNNLHNAIPFTSDISILDFLDPENVGSGTFNVLIEQFVLN